MEIPESVQVGAITYKIHCSEEAINKAKLERNDAGVIGVAYHTQCWIAVDPAIPEQRKRLTILHEVTHCILHDGTLDWGKEVNEEQFVTSLSRRILDTMRRNPDLVAFLME